jgi:hypothetical protein
MAKKLYIVVSREAGLFLGLDAKLHSEYPNAALFSTANVAHNAAARSGTTGAYDVVTTDDYAAGIMPAAPAEPDSVKRIRDKLADFLLQVTRDMSAADRAQYVETIAAEFKVRADAFRMAIDGAVSALNTDEVLRMWAAVVL